MSDEIEYLPCFGGPLDGDYMSSLRSHDVMQPWGNDGVYLRTPGRYIRAIYRKVEDGPLNPLLRLVNDGWVWRALGHRESGGPAFHPLPPTP